MLLQIVSMLWEDLFLDNTHARWTFALALCLAIAATMLGLFAAGDNVFAADVSIAQWSQQWQGGLPDALERLGDMLGYTPTAIVVLVGGAVISALLRAWQRSAFFIVTGMLRLAGMVLKPIFESPRPDPNLVQLPSHAHGFGYPSGHSMTAAMIATIVVMIARDVSISRHYRWLITGLAIVLAVLVGWSRVWSGAHWPTDVIGGWSYGVAIVLLAWALTRILAGLRTD